MQSDLYARARSLDSNLSLWPSLLLRPCHICFRQEDSFGLHRHLGHDGQGRGRLQLGRHHLTLDGLIVRRELVEARLRVANDALELEDDLRLVGQVVDGLSGGSA